MRMRTTSVIWSKFMICVIFLVNFLARKRTEKCSEKKISQNFPRKLFFSGKKLQNYLFLENFPENLKILKKNNTYHEHPDNLWRQILTNEHENWPMNNLWRQILTNEHENWPMINLWRQIWPMSSRTPKTIKKVQKIMFCEEYIDFRVYFLIWVLSARWSRSESRFRRTDQRPREPGWQIGRELTNARGALNSQITSFIYPLYLYTP